MKRSVLLKLSAGVACAIVLMGCGSGAGKDGKTAEEDSFEEFICPCCVEESIVVVDEPVTVVEEPVVKEVDVR